MNKGKILDLNKNIRDNYYTLFEYIVIYLF